MGLIGGSIGLALRRAGWHVTGSDTDEIRARRALDLGAIDAIGLDTTADLTFVATPVGITVDVAQSVLERNRTGVVTDVGSVKGPVVRAVDDARFVGGHPMAGSEQEGVEGADADLFAGATWVLTPDDATDAGAYALVQNAVAAMGAEVVAVPAGRHDELVAVVSHVPHLTAAALMGLAATRAEEHATVLRLAAGGFRDMTRVAAGHPGIWPDICAENRDAIVAALDRLVESLQHTRSVVAGADRAGLLSLLERARAARISLPIRAVARGDELAEVRVPVPDRPGVLAEVTTLAGELGVNIEDLEIAHSAEGDRGVLILVVDTRSAEVLRDALGALGHVASVQGLA